jgi:exoribonuclease R
VRARRPQLVSIPANDALIAALAALRSELEIPSRFPEEVEAEARRAAETVPADPTAAHLDDLRDIEFVTIDPAGSQDLDQAVHLERTASGAILHYAIADLPAFVEPGGAVDDEARLRGHTLYAADGRVPLHPTVLSEGAASLFPDRDRRAFVWRFVLDEAARPVETTLRRAVVRSRAQWSYVDAQRAVDAGTAPASLQALAWFGPLRSQREEERGGASLSMPETRVVARDGGYRLERNAPLPIETWNSQVSLLTGMAAADIMLRGRVGVLRTMPAADPADVETFRAQTAVLGIPWRGDVSYGAYLRELDRATPAALAIVDAAARLFRGAGYVAFDGTPPAAAEQAAIGAPYAHTTAPLRRLVDRWSLIVCEALANERAVPAWARDSLPLLPKIMGRSEGLANRLDAATIDRVEAAAMTGREGAEFDAVVVGRRGDGARVQIAEPPITSNVADLDAPAGSVVRVRLIGADIATGGVTFMPVR